MLQKHKTPLIKVIFLSATGFFMFVCMDSTAKYLGSVMPVTQVIWGRFFFSFYGAVFVFFSFQTSIKFKKKF